MIKLKLSTTLTLPAEAITQTIGILAKRGAGKSYTASVLAEEFVAAKLPFCVLDPTGAWWGLRVLADGSPGLPVVIIGGKHGDIPLEPTAGKLIADLIVDNPGFYVLDLSMFDSNANQDRFATDFAERLYRRKQQSREPLHLFVDEADSMAPQRPYRGQERMLGAFEALCRRGRIYGIGVTLISQRAAVINKNVLNQIEVLIALQTTAPHDRDAIESWAEGHGTKKQVDELMSSLASLGLGEAWIWSPSWLELFKRVQIRERTTFNSSATPKVGEIRKEPKALAPVDIEKLRKLMAETIERVKTDDPAVLRKQIMELRKHKCPVVQQNPVKIEKIEVPMVGKRALEGLKKSEAGMRRIHAAMIDANKVTLEQVRIVEKHIAKFATILNILPKKIEHQVKQETPRSPTQGTDYLIRQKLEGGAKLFYVKEGDGEFRISRSQQAILDALAWLESIGVNEADKTQVALLADQSPTSGGYFNNLGTLRGTNLIEYPRPGILMLTDAGRASANPDTVPTTSDELHNQLFKKLSASQVAILKTLIAIHPEQISKNELADRAGQEMNKPMSATSGGYFNNLGYLRSLKLIDYPTPGMVVAEKVLFLDQ